MSSEIRISDAERDAAVSALGEHYAAGRLTKDEYDERAEQVWAAKTASQLRPLFADLPSAHTAPATGPAGPAGTDARRASAPSGRSGPPWAHPSRIPVLPIVLVVLGVVLLTHLWPLLLIAGVAWLVLGHHRRGYRHWGPYGGRRW